MPATPVVDADGQQLGILCVLDQDPRTLNDEERTTLGDLAAMIGTDAKTLEFKYWDLPHLSRAGRFRSRIATRTWIAITTSMMPKMIAQMPTVQMTP